MTVETLERRDARIKRDVLDELEWDSRVDVTDVGVEVREGLVCLTGHVRNYGKKLAAQEAAHRVTGVLDVVNERLIEKGEEPIAFDSDCREGICGMCSMVINGRPHGPQKATTTCQLHMRQFKNGDHIYIAMAGPHQI